MQADDPMKGMIEVADLVAIAGGELVGRTKLQKTQALLELVGLGHGFPFVYKYFGPYSQELFEATETAKLFGEIAEERHPAQWGGTFSIFRTTRHPPQDPSPEKVEIIRIARDADPIELELAVTAAFLAKIGCANAWEETAKRKPDKATHVRLEGAKKLYNGFKAIHTPDEWPL